jgi:hypothetical protein
MKLVRRIVSVCESTEVMNQACGFEMLYQESKNHADATNVTSLASVRDPLL